MDDFVQTLYRLAIKVLNERYKSFNGLSLEWFPPDEWNEQEQHELVDLCSRIERDGYDQCVRMAETEKGRETLNLLAGYYIFVDTVTCKSILGVAIMAELLIEPFTSDSYGTDLERSQLFANLQSAEKEEVLFLFHLARFVRNNASSHEPGVN